MKHLKRFIIFILVVCIILGVIGIIFSSYKGKNHIDETRQKYNVGTCYDMTEDLCYYIIFIDDEESKWTTEDREIFINKIFLPSMTYLSQQAAEYNTEIITDYQVCEKNVIYNGVLDTDTKENGGQYNILGQVAKSMGHNSHWEMTHSLKKELDVKQVAYLLAVNKEGRSYKHEPPYGPFEKPTEFCVFFTQSIGYSDTTCYSTIGHEILHLFGAEDYYSFSAEYPERSKLIAELYPDDIMFFTANDINDKNIGEYTAYAVGWTDSFPDECDTEIWWK